MMYRYRFLVSLGSKLKRLVFEEAHVYLTQKHFRPNLHGAKYLSPITCAKILLSATIPPKLEQQLFNVLSLPSTTKVIREPCIQKQAKYHHIRVIDRKDKTENQVLLAVKTIARLLCKQLFNQTSSRGIIFFKNKHDCDAAAKELAPFATVYYSDHPDRVKNMKTWITDSKVTKNKIICSTTALIAGLDMDNINFILFAEIPYGFIDFIQGSGRGGRNGTPCYVVLVDNGKYSKPEDAMEDEYTCTSELIDWCQDSKKTCYRSGIGAVMDGVAHICAELENAQLCALCQPNDRITKLINSWSTLAEDDLLCDTDRPILSIA